MTLEIPFFTCALCGAQFAELRGGKCAQLRQDRLSSPFFQRLVERVEESSFAMRELGRRREKWRKK